MDMLAAFVALAETQSFAAAGRRLRRDPTVISRRVQALEAQLGVRLAERTTRRFVLTEAGRVYLDRLRPILRDLQAAQRDVSAFNDGVPQGHLRLALPASFGRMWLSPILTDFLIAHPLVSVEVEYADRFVDLIAEGFDLAVRLGVLTDSRLIARKLGDRRRILCASPLYLERHGAPDTLEALSGHACLRFSGAPSPSVWSFLDSRGKPEGVSVSGPLTSDDGEALVAAAVTGLGIVNATDWLVGRELAAGSLVPVLQRHRIQAEGAVYLLMPSSVGLPSKSRAFVDWLVREMRSPPWRVSTTASLR